MIHQVATRLISKLWSGWGTLAGVFLIFALWQIGYEAFGPLVLPEPLEALTQLGRLLNQPSGLENILITAKRAFAGFFLASAFGITLGLIAGWSNTLSLLCKPFITVALGVPPIAWIVLALLWFGGNDGTPIFTVFISTVPLVFAGALQGVRMREAELDEMAGSFHISLFDRFWHVQAPQIVSYLFPAWATALGLSWKVVVMAELLASTRGIGAGLAEARVNIDTASTMAWIVVVVGLLLIIEGMLLNPIKDYVEGWKHAD
ncbi:ABC transporter permease subunit [Pseudovibrio sp. Tun.PSC04-5.I4]|uniref:ABC transporter permease n=1 Tax=Pseudovibrio sp. Tun.PSC04-5.I4 TaxID=1798213 RepID=UPI0008900345|nr:ABC transporter permease subunit [Pseudovibrio sp. Tun.PSC04-5.I4]SDR47714.1 NitT/TauT family transport system permease protein [Pseudovibrio sp. Tun.PSC04-5.I4]